MGPQNQIEDEWDVEYELPAAIATKNIIASISASNPECSQSPTETIFQNNLRDQAECDADTSEWSGQPVPHRKRPKAFPAFTARSALFKATRAKGTFDRLTPIQAQGAKIEVMGPKLDMRDKRVWEIAIELAKERAGSIGDRFEIELRQFARRMGNDQPNSRALHAIWNSLTRLAMARVSFEVDGGRIRGVGSLLATACRDGDRSFLRLNPDFALPALLCDRQFELNPARRSAIGSALGQWLHDFYCTHSTARPIDLGYLMKLCGYDGPAKNFPAKVRAAMDELLKAAPAVVDSYVIREPTRRFEDWVLEVQIGIEKRSYQQPAALPRPTRKERKAAL